MCLNTRLLLNQKFQILIIFIEIKENVCLLYAHHVMTSIILHIRRPNCQWKFCYALGFYVSADYSFFSFSWAEKQVFHIVPFRPTMYVLKILKCLEVSNRVRKWNKVKNNIYVWSKFQLCQFELPIYINKLMWQSSLINSVSFVFCEFNRVASWNEGKTIILVRTSFKFPHRNTGFILKINECQSKHVFSNIILKETLVLMFLASHFVIIEKWKLNGGYRDIYYAKKILNTFACLEFRILVGKKIVYECHILPRPLLQTWRLETTSLCLNTRLLLNKKFPNSHYLYWN